MLSVPTQRALEAAHRAEQLSNRDQHLGYLTIALCYELSAIRESFRFTNYHLQRIASDIAYIATSHGAFQPSPAP